MDSSNPEVRDQERNGKKPSPKFENGKGIKKKHSQNSGTGRERKNPFPFFENGNQRLSFPRIAGNRNRNVKQKTKSSCSTNMVTKLHTTYKGLSFQSLTSSFAQFISSMYELL